MFLFWKRVCVLETFNPHNFAPGHQGEAGISGRTVTTHESLVNDVVSLGLSCFVCNLGMNEGKNEWMRKPTVKEPQGNRLSSSTDAALLLFYRSLVKHNPPSLLLMMKLNLVFLAL